jgi:hypothetical protein
VGAGLIWGSLAQGLGNAATTVGQGMAQEQAETRRLEATMADRAAAREEALARMRENQEFRADEAEKNRIFREQMAGGVGGGGGGSGGGGGGGGNGAMLSDEAAAAKMDMSVPEYQQFRESERTGNYDAYKQSSPLPGPTENGEPLMGPADLPAGFKDFIKAKRAQFAGMAEESAYRGNYDEITKGRRTQVGNEFASGIVSGAMSTQAGAERIAATEGKGAYGKGGVNEFTGAPDQVGRSAINENNAQAGSASAAAGKYRAETGHVGESARTETLKALTQERIAATSAAAEARREVDALRSSMKDMSKSEKAATQPALEAAQNKLARYEEDRDNTASRIREYTSAGKISAEGKTSVAEKAKPGDNGNVKSAPGKPVVINTLPPGSKQIGTSGGRPVYQTPDGKKFLG